MNVIFQISQRKFGTGTAAQIAVDFHVENETMSPNSPCDSNANGLFRRESVVHSIINIDWMVIAIVTPTKAKSCECRADILAVGGMLSSTFWRQQNTFAQKFILRANAMSFVALVCRAHRVPVRHSNTRLETTRRTHHPTHMFPYHIYILCNGHAKNPFYPLKQTQFDL